VAPLAGLVALVALLAVAVPSWTSPGSAEAAGGVPNFRHVYWIWMENREFGSVASGGSYEVALARRYGLAANYDAIGHYSEMNYINATAGQAVGVTDGDLRVGLRSLFDQLDTADISWHQYAQSYPGGPTHCFTNLQGPTNLADGPGMPGQYVARHTPAMDYADISKNVATCERHVSDLASFDPAAARFEFITPNLCNDAHSCPLATGDAFLRAFVPRILNSPAFAGSLLVITYDEGTTKAGQLGDDGGHVYTIVASPTIHGQTSAVYHDHWGLLRTVEDAWNLPCLAGACHRTAMTEFFAGGSGAVRTPRPPAPHPSAYSTTAARPAAAPPSSVAGASPPSAKSPPNPSPSGGPSPSSEENPVAVLTESPTSTVGSGVQSGATRNAAGGGGSLVVLLVLVAMAAAIGLLAWPRLRGRP
jgi:acid phosphatase